MSMFKVGDIISPKKGCDNSVRALLHSNKEYRIAEIAKRNGDDFIIIEGKYETGGAPRLGVNARHLCFVSSSQGAARASDPDTSKAAASLPRKSIKDLMREVFVQNPKCTYTGEELAAKLGKRLNSVTPRFAELALTMKDSGIRRNGQIAWTLNVG